MKKRIIPHSENIGPKVSIDLDDVSVIEEYGDRAGNSGWVDAHITLKSNKTIRIRVTAQEMDSIVESWENITAI